MLLLLWRKAKQAGDPDYVLEKQLTDVGNAAKTWKVKRKDESVKKKLFSVSYIVCIINRWKIISDKAVKFVNPSENTDFLSFAVSIMANLISQLDVFISVKCNGQNLQNPTA